MVKPSFTTLADCAIGLAAIAIAAQVGFHLFERWDRRVGGGGKPAEIRRPTEYRPGDTVPANPKLELAGAEQTLILFVRSGCRYCTASMPFYRQLAEAARHQAGGVRLVAVSHEPREILARYLEEHQVRVDSAVSLSPAELRHFRVNGTPTLLLVTRKQVVRKAWIGQLNEPQQRQVFASIGALQPQGS